MSCRSRRGFSSLTALVFLALASAMAGSLAARASFGFSLAKDASCSDALLQAARFGVRSAEDWLLTAISSGNIPNSRRAPMSSLYEYIEVVLPGGGRAECKSPFAGVKIELYAAEASYGPELFHKEATSIPDIQEIMTPLGVKRHYFLRSSASMPGRPGRIVCEELIAVTIAANRIADLERVFFRSRP